MIEEGLAGEECSLLVLCDGTRAVPLVPAQDFKRIGDGDTGPNTGGMGAYSPMPEVGSDEVDAIMEDAVLPLWPSCARRGIDYRGVLYAGLMLTADGPKVLEYNVRFGDPEAQVVLPLLASDPAELLLAAATGNLDELARPTFLDDAAVCVVLAAAGYPERPADRGLHRGPLAVGQLAAPAEGVTVFHAGTSRRGEGPFHTAGGRVLGVTAVAPTPAAARSAAYEAAGGIEWGRSGRSRLAIAASVS